jgi:uncharacterized damage-inducible protein DinB
MEKRYGAPVAGNEKEVLSGFLDHYRRTLLEICDGLTDEQLRRVMVPSGTSLLGLVKHLTYVEYGWFQEYIGREDFPLSDEGFDPGDLQEEEGETAQEIFDEYRRACASSGRVLADASLDEVVEDPDGDVDYNVRWVVVHMIEETARHAGHADILREQIDGRTGAGYE